MPKEQYIKPNSQGNQADSENINTGVRANEPDAVCEQVHETPVFGNGDNEIIVEIPTPEKVAQLNLEQTIKYLLSFLISDDAPDLLFKLDQATALEAYAFICEPERWHELEGDIGIEIRETLQKIQPDTLKIIQDNSRTFSYCFRLARSEIYHARKIINAFRLRVRQSMSS